MSRKKFRIIMIVFVMVSICVLAAFSIRNFTKKSDTDGQNSSDDKINENVTDGYNNTTTTDALGVSYYVNEDTISKKTEKKFDVTRGWIYVKLFINNESNKEKTYDPDLFRVVYETGDNNCLLDGIDYGELEKPVVVQAHSTISINFAITFVLNDPQVFVGDEKKELKFSYADEQILICLA